MKENSSIWDLLAKRTDHSLSKEEAEALEQMLKEDTSLQRASQLVDDSLVNMDTRQVEEVMNRTWSKVESGMKANRKPRLKLIIRRVPWQPVLLSYVCWVVYWVISFGLNRIC